MAKDYVVRFTGEDNLSQTINKIKSELKDFGGDAQTISYKVEQINRALNNSNYRRAQKEIMNLLVDLERLGEGSSSTAVHLRELGASIVDAVGDARQEMRLMSSDTANFDAAIEGFNLIASTASIATGAMALFGEENQNVTEAIAKVQGAMGILNGIQQVSNMLNKDSILMLQLKSKWQAIKEAATIKDTVATTANNVAEGISKVNSLSSATAKGVDTAATIVHTTATSASTVAQTAWNLTKAIGKSLLGDFTGLLIVGAGALGAYALSTSKSTDETEKLNTSTNKVTDTFSSTYASSLAQTMTKYQLLRNEYINLKTEHQRVEWIRENKTEFENLGLSVNSVTDAEDVFISNTDKMVEALTKRAQAAAAQKVAEEYFKKEIETQNSLDDANENLTWRKRTANELGAKLRGDYNYKDNHRYKSNGKWAKQQEENKKKYHKKGLKAIEYSKQKGAEADKILGKYAYKPKTSTPSSSSSTSRHTQDSNRNYTPTKKDDFETGSIADYQNQIAKLDEQLTKLNLTDEKRNKLMADREVLQKKVDTLKGKNEKEPEKSKYELGSIGDLKKQSSNIEDWLENLNLSLPIRLVLINKKAAIEKQIEELENPLQAQIEAEQNRAKQREDLQQKQIEGYQAIGQSAAAMGQIMSATGADGAAAVMQMVAATADGVAQIIPQIMALIGAKKGEALASGTASAAALPFPANIAGIAAIVATVFSTFATISSVVGSFANGGIISTGAADGDMALARVNSGEMILNGTQQKKLFDMLDSGGGVGNNIGGNVVFTISGSNLKGVLRNYDSKMNKIK